MTAASVEPRTWPPLKWAAVAAGILALQAGFFFWFARPPGLPPRPFPSVLAIRMPDGQPADLSGFVSPLVLVRPDAHGFSGPAWLQTPSITYNPEQSNPPPFLLELQTDRLGAGIAQALSNGLSRRFEVAGAPGPRFDNFSYSPGPAATVPDSTLTVEGELAGRPLLTRPVLKAQPADTILSNTVLYVVVDVQGRVFAPPVLEPTGLSGSAPADADAVATAAGLLFQPLLRAPGQPPPAASSLTPGRLVFHWQTIPKPAPAAAETTAARQP
jgi:hypothetical protein